MSQVSNQADSKPNLFVRVFEGVWLTVNQIVNPPHPHWDKIPSLCSSLLHLLRLHYFDYAPGMMTVLFATALNSIWSDTERGVWRTLWGPSSQTTVCDGLCGWMTWISSYFDALQWWWSVVDTRPYHRLAPALSRVSCYHDSGSDKAQ